MPEISRFLGIVIAMSLLLGALLGLLTVGCGGTKQSPEELTIQENVPLAASDADAPEWIGIAGGKGQGERALFEKVIELKRPVPRGGSIGIHLQMRKGAPLPSVLVYRGTNRWAEDNVFVGEFRVREWPRPDENSVVARVGFQITEQHALLMWLRAFMSLKTSSRSPTVDPRIQAHQAFDPTDHATGSGPDPNSRPASEAQGRKILEFKMVHPCGLALSMATACGGSTSSPRLLRTPAAVPSVRQVASNG